MSNTTIARVGHVITQRLLLFPLDPCLETILKLETDKTTVPKSSGEGAAPMADVECERVAAQEVGHE